MSYISWDKKKVINLEFTLNREVLRSNALGAFLATTMIGCNTRKYHGLLVVPQPQLDNNNHVLLSSLDETIIENKEEFHLGVHMYPNGIFAPRGTCTPTVSSLRVDTNTCATSLPTPCRR